MRFYFFLPAKTLLVLVFCIVANDASAQFTTIKSSEGIEIQEHGKKVLFYQSKPQSLNGKYERAGYIHPLYSLRGNGLTEDFPEDHPYHHGIFWTWHQIILNNKPIADGWVSDSISWQVQDVKMKKGKEKVSLLSAVIWNAQTEPGKRTGIIKENTIITVYAGTNKKRIIDFDIQLYALVDSLRIGGSDDVKGYGGFCLRLKLPDDIEFVSNDTLITPREIAITAGRRMDFRGSFDGSQFPKSGVMLSTQPIGNDRQQTWILRRQGSMQNIVYPGRKPVLLSKKGMRMRYRMVVHEEG
ncbi:MAG: hypothetical protein JWM28_671 [Chitinophagaceae bacterium]|nr:hypothetical protein [Chitinophagaceae bacterium]